MPSHNLDPNDPKNVARLLLCVLLEHGGELRIKASTYDSLDRGRLLLVDWDKQTNEVVMRASSDFGRVIIVPPESQSWTMPSEVAPTERARIEAERASQHRVVRSDEELADLEEKLNRQGELSRMAKEGTLPRQPFRVQK